MRVEMASYWRQPTTDGETLALMTGASSDPFAGFGWDGDERWTPSLLREWWARRQARAPLVGALLGEWTNDTSAGICISSRQAATHPAMTRCHRFSVGSSVPELPPPPASGECPRL